MLFAKPSAQLFLRPIRRRVSLPSLSPFRLERWKREAGSVTAFAVALLAGCAAERTAPLSAEAVLLPVEAVRQDGAHECGLASLAALAGAYGVALPPEEHRRLEELARAGGGIAAGELRGALVRAGLEARLFRGTLDRSPTGIYRHLDAGRPVLVRLGLAGGREHFACVVGYDLEPARILVLDPGAGTLAFERGGFARAWERGGRLALLASPGGGAPAEREPARPPLTKEAQTR